MPAIPPKPPRGPSRLDGTAFIGRRPSRVSLGRSGTPL
jgi:hypothetical protein